MTNTRQPATGGGLHITTGLGAPQSKLDAIVEKFATTAVIEEDLQKMGIQDQEKPAYALTPITADQLTTTDSRQYTTLYAHHLAWYNYLAPVLAKVKVGLLQSENTFDLLEAEIRNGIQEQNKLMLKEDKLGVKEVTTKVLTHPSYQEALLDVQRWKQYKIRLDTQVEIAERNMSVISRQVEIRRQEIEGGQRESNMPRNPQPLRR